jgi:hypothetical protein
MKKLFKILLISFIIVLIPVIGVAALIYATAFSNWWLKFPEPQKSQIALARIESLGSGISCRDNCFGDKLTYRQMIFSQMEKRGYDSGVGKLMIDHVTWESKDVSYRREVVSMIRDNENNKKEKDPNYVVKVPQKLMDYLNKTGGNVEVKSQILTSFPEDAGANMGFVSDLLTLIQDKTKSSQERSQAMTDLSDIMNDYNGTNEEPIVKYNHLDYEAVCDVFLIIAEAEKGKSPEDLNFRKHTLNSLNSCLQYKEFYKEEFFNRLKAIFYEEGVHPGIQNEIMTELNYFKRVDLEKYLKLMVAINSNKELNILIRRSAGRELENNNRQAEKIDLPEGPVEKLFEKLDFYTN